MTAAASQRIGALVELRRWPEVVEATGTALAENPDDRHLLGWLAQAQLGLMHPNDALRTALRMTATYPDDEWGHRLASAAYRRIGDHPMSVFAAREAVRVAPGQPTSHQALATALANEGRNKTGAANAAAEAVRIAPDDPESHFAAGYVAQKAGRKAQARVAYLKVLELDPTHSVAQNNLGALNSLWALKSARMYASSLRADPTSETTQRNLHRTMTTLTFNLYMGTAVGLAVASGLVHLFGGPSLVSRLFGVAFVVAAIGYVVAVCRQIPRGAWRHTSGKFGIPGAALWNLVPITMLTAFLLGACFTRSVSDAGSQAIVPLAIVATVLVSRRVRGR